VLKKQREQVLQYVTQLEKQLPSKAEMDALLSDINQAGLGRSLQFDLFRPGQIACATTTPNCRSPCG
jgi:type IV pilus assembly protein PilO